mmetsp:Transcript_17529/g.42057  ORF Transcript_17529/g.42057 Transcript_17529/m.42057 type:complete len:86 (+) Transcript_17529:632-889(+)
MAPRATIGAVPGGMRWRGTDAGMGIAASAVLVTGAARNEIREGTQALPATARMLTEAVVTWEGARIAGAARDSGAREAPIEQCVG